MALVEIQRENSCPINQKLPIEILTMIFLLLGPSSFQDPYIYLPLSWVCRQWRFIVLNTSVFWTVIEHGQRTKLQSLARDVIFRSKPREIDVAAYSVCPSPQSCNNCSAKSYLNYFKHFRIRTLFLQGHSLDLDFSYRKNLTLVDNLILSRVYVQLSNQRPEFFYAFLSALNPRFMELSSKILYQQVSHSLLDRLEWLKLHVPSYNWDFSAASYFLEALPNLRILNLIDGTHLPAARVTNLPNLRILTMDAGPHSIKTLALNYLGISPFCSDTYKWDHLNNINFSTMKSLRLSLCYNQYVTSSSVFGSVVCISTGLSEEDCDFFNHFHASVSYSKYSIDYPWTLPPPNSFHISFHWLMNHHEALYSQLKQRTTNLVELIVDYRSVKKSKWISQETPKAYNRFLGEILSNFDRIIHLSVLRSRSFASVCDLLMDGRRLPRLERLTYHSSHKPSCKPKIVSRRMEMVRDARVEAHSEPLKILELKNFVIIPQNQIKKIEKLGIRLIQHI